MKKIMKKALSLVLALVMVFTLAPMTAMAAGTGTESDPIEVSATQTITTDGTGQSVYYVYNAPVAADYEILVTGAVDSFGNAMIHPMTGMPMENYAMNGQLYLYAYGTDEVAFSLFDYESQELTITITMIEGTEIGGGADSGATGVTPDDAISLTEDEPFATLPGGSMLYYKVEVEAGADYTLSLSTKSYDAFDLYLYNSKLSQYGYFTSSENNVIETTVTPDSTEYIFAIGNPNDLEMSVLVSMVKEGGSDAPVNDIDNPEVITEMGTYNSAMPAGAFSYWYKWTATQAGVLTVTTTNEGGYAGFTVNGDWECTTESLDNGGKVMVAAGDVVVFYVSPAGASTVNMTVSFEEGATIEVGGGEGDGTESNFEWGNPIVVGDNALPGPSNWAYTYTLHEFAPGETGKYTFTTTDSQIGIVSTNGMWINVGNPGEDYDVNNVPYLVVIEDEIVWECNDENQAIWIAVMPFEGTANVNVTREDLVVEEISSENAYATISLSPYSFKGELDDLKHFMYGFADEKITFLPDDNGYYHVVSLDDFDEDGGYIGEKEIEELPLILVKLNDSVLSLQSAIGYGNVKYVFYNTDGEIPVAEHIIYFNGMIEEYLECAATTDKLYPLTDDLALLMQMAGEDQGWYEEGGAVESVYAKDKVPTDCLFTFAMYYLEQDIVTLDKEDQVVDKDAMADLIEDNKTNGTVLNTTAKNDKNEEVTVTFTFAAGTMKPVEGKEEYSFNVSLVESYDKATEDKAEIEKDDFVLRVNFEYTGELPAEATIYIPVPAEYINTTLYYYQILADGTLKYVCDAPVDGAGNAKVTQDHCSDYVLLAEKIVEDTVAPGGTTTGDSTNFALWIAVLGLGIVAIAGSVVMRKREF